MDIEDAGLVLKSPERMRTAAREVEAAEDGLGRLRAYDAFVMAYISASDDECLDNHRHLTTILAEALSHLRARLGLSEAVDVGPGAIRERLNVFEDRFKREVAGRV